MKLHYSPHEFQQFIKAILYSIMHGTSEVGSLCSPDFLCVNDRLIVLSGVFFDGKTLLFLFQLSMSDWIFDSSMERERN